MRGVNKITLMGNLTRDPEVKQTNNGTPVARIGLATGRKWKDQNGNLQEETEFHTVVAWSNLAKLAEQYLAKGAPIYVEGRMTYRKYTDKTGAERNVAEVVASDIVFLPRGGQAQAAASTATAADAEMDEAFSL